MLALLNPLIIFFGSVHHLVIYRHQPINVSGSIFPFPLLGPILTTFCRNEVLAVTTVTFIKQPTCYGVFGKKEIVSFFQMIFNDIFNPLCVLMRIKKAYTERKIRYCIWDGILSKRGTYSSTLSFLKRRATLEICQNQF